MIYFMNVCVCVVNICLSYCPDLPFWTNRRRVRNGNPNPDIRCRAMERTSSFADTLPGSPPEGGLQQRSPTGHLLPNHGVHLFIRRNPTPVDHQIGTTTMIHNQDNPRSFLCWLATCRLIARLNPTWGDCHDVGLGVGL